MVVEYCFVHTALPLGGTITLTHLVVQEVPQYGAWTLPCHWGKS